MLKKGYATVLCFALLCSILSVTGAAESSNTSFSHPHSNQLHSHSSPLTLEKAQRLNTDIGTESVIGTDDRYLISDPASSPKYSNIGKLEFISGSGQRAFCTASLVSPTVALTSAHCAFDKHSGKYSTNMAIYFGKSGTSHVKAASVTKIYVPSSYKKYEPDLSMDWAVLKLDQHVSKHHFVIRYIPKVGDIVELAGYPGDKGGEHMYGHTNTIVRQFGSWNGGAAHHNIDTYGGQSGSPLLDYPYIRGVHSRAGIGRNHNEAALVSAQMQFFVEEFSRQ
ncbi:trypsin-like serine peptidase [Paenibacillus sp. 481]|uniref:trypsin-like serine peptidase n=1 Tax=Paenibacillus sp. 481 TaxID=2835869 RepID=UPI001E40BC82|nr:trypsin-like serine protease [Paenibacillus sp. 481]UHA72438.1 trypsin-like serine protease [Paenibacillus sp. 481]